MTIIKHVIDAAQGKHPLSERRSSEWPKVRAQHLKEHPTCAACGGSEKLEVHHIQPFHLDHSKELDPENLITLCESGHGGVNCHLHFGHLGSFKSWNTSVPLDAPQWLKKIKERP